MNLGIKIAMGFQILYTKLNENSQLSPEKVDAETYRYFGIRLQNVLDN